MPIAKFPISATVEFHHFTLPKAISVCQDILTAFAHNLLLKCMKVTIHSFNNFHCCFLLYRCQQHPGISKTATDAESNYTRLPHNLLDQW